MSVRVWNAVWRLRIGNKIAKVVLLNLAHHSDEHGGNAWPSVATIAEECEISQRAAAYALDELRDAGLIVEQQRARQHLSTTYEIHLEHAEAIPPRPRPGEVRTARGAVLNLRPALHPVQPSTAPGAGSALQNETPSTAPGADNPSYEPSNESAEEPARPPNPPLSRGALRALNGSHRRRDAEALAAERGPNDRYFDGKYGAILRQRLEEGERDAM